MARILEQNAKLIEQNTVLIQQVNQNSQEFVALKMLVGRISDEVTQSRQNLEQQMSRQFAGLTTMMLAMPPAAKPGLSGASDGDESPDPIPGTIVRSTSRKEVTARARPRRMSLNANTTAGV